LFTFRDTRLLVGFEGLENLRIGEEKILLISDFQTGSPTMRPEQAVKQIVHALEEGVDHIFLNGDLIQGWNYPVFAQESQAFGPIDPQDQVEFVKQMLKVAIGETVRAKRAADPDYAPPKITITDGNHEWNSGDRKFPGRWLNPIRDMLAGIYDGLGVDGDKDVRYISEIDTKHGDHVFASAVYFDDIKEATGFGVFGQHCNYGASKGGKLGAPAEGMAAWTRARGVDTADNHFYLGAHYHTSSIVEEDGQVHIIAGAMAGQSAYEFARGYTDGEPASGMLTLNSREAPTLELVTARMVDGIEDGAIEAQGVAAKVAEHGSVEAWLQQLQEDCKMRAFHTHQMKTYGPGAKE
ncbi:MAG: metallophosphoesterase, partial [Myxococcota bacterium]